jgi:hypothetical protein
VYFTPFGREIQTSLVNTLRFFPSLWIRNWGARGP